MPHAGYVYSGHVAGAVYARIALPKRFLILGVRHYPRGEPAAILSSGAWRTPLGDAPIDEALAAALLKACPLLREDSVAHRAEHSLEVQLPFLKVLAPDFSFVPVALGTVQDSVAHRAEHSLEVQLPFLKVLAPDFSFVPVALGTVRFEELVTIGEALARILETTKHDVLLLTTSDLNHYEDDATTRVKDHKAIEQLLARDARGLYDACCDEHISMCGLGPAVAMLTALKALGAKNSELVKYATSADVSGDRDAVVGYAGMIFS